jgi:hypothetical protein
MSLGLANPLPVALRHYQEEVQAVLHAAGVSTEDIPTQSIERDTGSLAGRLSRSVRSRWALRARPVDALLLWPAFGLLDPLTLTHRAARTWLVVHDPVPLRRQRGSGAVANALGRMGLSGGPQILVHSEPAKTALQQRGWPSSFLPHPTLPPREVPPRTGDNVHVLGQWKPARSDEALTMLARDGDLDGRRRISGRGWAPVEGWDVSDRFLTEAELDEQIRDSAAVVLPYERYFQSGIAIRCLEAGVPVIGKRHPFLEDTFGPAWPGLVSDGDWSAAVRRAVAVPQSDIRERHRQHWNRCVREWSAVFARVGSG